MGFYDFDRLEEDLIRGCIEEGKDRINGVQRLYEQYDKKEKK